MLLHICVLVVQAALQDFQILNKESAKIIIEIFVLDLLGLKRTFFVVVVVVVV